MKLSLIEGSNSLVSIDNTFSFNPSCATLNPEFVKIFVQPQIYSTLEIADKCAPALVRRDAIALIRLLFVQVVMVYDMKMKCLLKIHQNFGCRKNWQ